MQYLRMHYLDSDPVLNDFLLPHQLMSQIALQLKVSPLIFKYYPDFVS
jgi:hypothetical protein